MVNSGTKSNWCLVTTDVCQESIGFILLVLTQMDWSVLSASLQVAQNCWSGVVHSLEARVDILVEQDITEQCPGRSLMTEQGTKKPKCFYVTLQCQFLGSFSEALSRLVSAHTNNSSDRNTSTLSLLFSFQVVIFIYSPISFC